MRKFLKNNWTLGLWVGMLSWATYRDQVTCEFGVGHFLEHVSRGVASVLALGAGAGAVALLGVGVVHLLERRR